MARNMISMGLKTRICSQGFKGARMPYKANCEYQEWWPGCRQSRSAGVPGFMWGNYYPGDEPHMQCRLNGGACREDTCPLEAEDEEWEKTLP